MKYTLKTIKKCVTYTKLDVCISCSLFEMINPYQKQGINMYIRKFLKWYDKIPRTAYVRLYVDASVLDKEMFIILMNENKYKKLEIVLYQFDDFLHEDQIHHDGTFGTMTRFLALYNQPVLPSNIKYVWTSDLDMHPYIFSYENILDLKRRNVDLSYYSVSCYNRPWVSDDVNFPVLAGKIITKTSVKYDFKLFKMFIDDVLSGKYKQIKQKLKEHGGRRYDMEYIKYFPYGFDELFTNLYLIKEFENHSILIYFNISLDYLKNDLPIPKEKEIAELEYKSWLFGSDKKVKEKLLKYNEQIYDYVKDKDFKSSRNKKCIANFNEYKDLVFEESALNWSLSVPIVVKKKFEIKNKKILE
jgi:hypothetical protein